MPYEHFWAGGMWIFPTFGMIIGIIFLLVVIFAIFGRGCFRPPWHEPSRHNHEESALDILRKRYAKGEITKEQFEQMKKDILS